MLKTQGPYLKMLVSLAGKVLARVQKCKPRQGPRGTLDCPDIGGCDPRLELMLKMFCRDQQMVRIRTVRVEKETV